MKAREYIFNDRDFLRIMELANRKSGIMIDQSKIYMVYGRLSRRLKILSLHRFKDYLDRVEEDDEESINFVNALTTNVTHFFREKHHFEFLDKHFFHEVLQQKKNKIRAWSAGCATGEEPYSLSLLWKTSPFYNQLVDFKILATDIDTNAINQSKKGIFTEKKLVKLPSRYQQWFKKTENCQLNEKEILSQAKDLISFKKLNLMQPWPIEGPFDLIMCRNVLIYFNKATQHQLISRFLNLLKQGGYLILGHSEGLNAEQHLSIDGSSLQHLGQKVYRKS